MTSEAKKAAKARYDAKTAKFYSLKLNVNTDGDIIDYLQKQESTQGTIKALIRAEISREQKKEEKKMNTNTIRIQFETGTSREGDYGVNYLIAAPSSGEDLYAEIRVPDGASDDFGYLALKQEIIRQAAESGIPADRLAFQYDGQEDRLSPDADGTARGLWYAVQRDREDDWSTGSYDREEAREMARKLRADYPDALIAVIDNAGTNPVCVDEITDLDD